MNHATQTNNALYLRRRSKICLPVAVGSDCLPAYYVASVLKNIEGLGFTFSQALIEACRNLSLEQLTALYQELVADLRAAKGAHREHRPMYPNFPAQVIAADEGELYLNAIVHYVTGGKLFPYTEKQERLPLLDEVKLRIIDLGNVPEFEALFGLITSANTSLSEQDREDLAWFAQTYGADILRLLPDTIPQKENLAIVAGLLLNHAANAANKGDITAFIGKFCRTATDVLRLAASLSGGDVSLATPTKFRSFKRAERGLLLALVDRQPNAIEDMLRWKDRWIRLGERLHPTEYARKYPTPRRHFMFCGTTCRSPRSMGMSKALWRPKTRVNPYSG